MLPDIDIGYRGMVDTIIDDLDRQPQVPNRPHKPNRFQRRILNLGLNHKDIDVAARRC